MSDLTMRESLKRHWPEYITEAAGHAVHHYALIGVMGGIMGLPMPPGFGVAPSTLKHQAEIMKPV